MNEDDTPLIKNGSFRHLLPSRNHRSYRSSQGNDLEVIWDMAVDTDALDAVTKGRWFYYYQNSSTTDYDSFICPYKNTFFMFSS